MVTDLIDALGDLGLFGLCLAVAFLAFSETAILLDLVVPGEVGLVLGGAAAAAAGHPVAPVVAAAALGATAGDTTSYLIGRRWGRPLIARFSITRRRFGPVIERAEAHFEEHGGRSVFFGRFVGALRAVVPFVAGVGRLPVGRFLEWNAAASILWGGSVVLAGYWLGEPVADTVDRIGTALSLAVVAVIAGAWWWRRRARTDVGPGASRPSPADSDPSRGAH